MKNVVLRAAMCLILAGVVLPSMTGCETFHDRWKAAANQFNPATNKAGRPTMTGRWSGTWESTMEEDKSHGTVRAIIQADPEQEGVYHAEFQAIYASVLWGEYIIPFETTYKDGKLYLTSEADLGWLGGGVYKYDGIVDRRFFWLNYDAKTHKGRMVLERID